MNVINHNYKKMNEIAMIWIVLKIDALLLHLLRALYSMANNTITSQTISLWV